MEMSQAFLEREFALHERFAGFDRTYEGLSIEKILFAEFLTSCVCRGHRVSQGVLNGTYLGRIDGEDGGSGRLEMGEDKKPICIFLKKPK
jgi:hypothetical protein